MYSPATCSRSPASCVRISEPPSTSDSAVASSSVSAIVSLGAVGVVFVGEGELATSVARLRTDRRRPSSVTMSWRTPMPGSSARSTWAGMRTIMAPPPARSRHLGGRAALA